MSFLVKFIFTISLYNNLDDYSKKGKCIKKLIYFWLGASFFTSLFILDTTFDNKIIYYNKDNNYLISDVINFIESLLDGNILNIINLSDVNKYNKLYFTF